MNSDILEAFYTIIDAAGLGVPIAYSGIKFTPPDNGKWLELSYLPNTGIDQSIKSASVLAQGLFQVNVCDRPNTGELALQNLAETVAALFPKNTPINGLARVSRAPYTSSMISLDDRIILPLTVSYSE